MLIDIVGKDTISIRIIAQYFHKIDSIHRICASDKNEKRANGMSVQERGREKEIKRDSGNNEKNYGRGGGGLAHEWII